MARKQQEQSADPSRPASEPFQATEGGREWRGPVLTAAAAVIGIAIVLITTHGKPISRRAPRNRQTAGTVSTTTAVPRDVNGVLISLERLDEFERDCNALAPGAANACRCARVHLPDRVAVADIDSANAFLTQHGGAMPASVKAILDACARATTSTVPAAGH